MLDYKKINSEFTKKLTEFDEARLLSWIKFDERRQLLSKLLDGETVSLCLLTKAITKINDNRENRTDNESSEFAMAA